MIYAGIDLEQNGEAPRKVGLSGSGTYRPAEAWKFEPFRVSVNLFPP